MVNSKGYRRGTRYLFRRPFGKHGPEHISTYLNVYKRGQLVHIKGNGAVQKGMPHKFYHGRTGRIVNVLKRAVQVMVNKRVRQRLIEKKVMLRVEHIKPARYAEGLKKKQERVAELKKAARKYNIWGLNTKIFGVEEPKSGHFVNVNKLNKPIDVTPIPYELVV
jgi:large subunit ribosomal protein L21e